MDTQKLEGRFKKVDAFYSIKKNPPLEEADLKGAKGLSVVTS